MKKLLLLLCVGTAAISRPAAGESPSVTRSARLTTAAEQLLEFEKKMVQNSPDLVWSVDADARFSFLSDTC